VLYVSPADAIHLTQRALALLRWVRRDDMRDALELSLETLRGIATAQVLGLGNDEAKAALLRALALLAVQPQHPMRGLLLHDLGFFLCMRGEYAEALALAERAGAASSDSADPTSLLALSPVHGQVNHLRGRPHLAREWIERGLVAGASHDDSTLQTTFAADARVELLGLSAMQLVHAGLVEQARARAREARTLARRLRQPMALAVALWFEGLVEVRLDNAERLLELADEMQAIVDEGGFAQGRPGCRWMRGWVLARTTDPIGGHRLLREAYEENVRLGMRAGGSEILGYATEALVRAGDWAAAQAQLEEALAVAGALAERVYLVQLLLLEATIADARGEPGAACASSRRAVAEAREQQAPWLELIALVELCRRNEADDAARRALAALVDRLVEADATQAVHRARQILDRSANA
jgi:tetratricopeptide (TPR) repeat protein